METARLNAAVQEEIDLTSENDVEDGVEELGSDSSSGDSSTGVMYIDILDMVTLEKIIASNRRRDSEQSSIGDDSNKDTLADYSSDESLNVEEMRERVELSMTRVAELRKKSDTNVDASRKPGVDKRWTGQQDKLYTCEICSKEFRDKGALRIHIQDHSSLRSHLCTFCKTTFAEQSQLQMHLNSVHIRMKPFVCKYCKQTFSQYSDLDKHVMEIHTGEKAFSCEICKKKFKYRWYIKKHMQTRMCTGIKANRNSCDISSKNIEKVKTNLESHECTVCGNNFSSRLVLQNHYQLVHSDTLISNYLCQICHRNFLTRAHLRGHVCEVHCGDKTNYICDICNTIFNRKHLIRSHILIMHPSVS